MNLKLAFGPWAVVGGLALCAIGVSILSGPTEYQAAAKIKIEPDDSQYDSSGTYVPYDPYFFETELKAISCDAVLSNVVKNLNLNTDWGKRYGETLDSTKTIEMVRQRMELTPVRNTKIIEISVTDEDPNEAARIANAIAEAYKDYRMAKQEQERVEGIKILEEDYAKEEAKILLMQSNVDRLREQLHIIDTYPKNSVSPGPMPTINNQQQQHLKELLLEDEAEYTKLKNEYTRLASLQATNPMVLRDVLPTMTSDDMLAGLLRELDDNMRKLAAETNGVGGASSDRAEIQASISDLNRKIDDRVDAIMITLQTKVDGAKFALVTVSNRLKQVEAADQAPAGQPYWEAKMNLQSEKATRDLLKAKIEAVKADNAIPKSIPVVIIDLAVPPNAPSGPNRTLGAVLLVCGLGMSGFGFYSIRNGGTKEETMPKPV